MMLSEKLAVDVRPELPPPSKADGEAGEGKAEPPRVITFTLSLSASPIGCALERQLQEATPIEDEGGGVIGEARG